MADFLVGHRKIKDQFFTQLNLMLDWNAISKVLDLYYQKGSSVAGRPSYPGLVSFQDVITSSMVLLWWQK